jgi:hypothetical protein
LWDYTAKGAWILIKAYNKKPEIIQIFMNWNTYDFWNAWMSLFIE